MPFGIIKKAGRMDDLDVRLRSMPYPYHAMLAICSDLDETPDGQVYWDIMRFLNTADETSMGPGADLEVGNSIYFDMPPDQFAYWNTDDAGREMIRTLIRSGHIDCLHSYGDLATKREHAARALDELERYDCRLEVWIDHGTAPTNFGSDIMKGRGDELGHQAYHADLTISYGVRYVWQGRVTSIIGQNVPAGFGRIFQPRHPIRSGKTIAKEAAKRFLARRGSDKYAMHGSNRVLQRCILRDNSQVYEFMRSNPHWDGVSSCETANGIGQVLTEAMLGRLVEREGVCILYTHLGKVFDPRLPFSKSTVAAFRRLADYYHNGRIMVTTTRRVLNYLAVQDQTSWSVCREKNALTIDLQVDRTDAVNRDRIDDDDLAGLTFYVPDAVSCHIRINEKIIENLQSNLPDHTGRPSVSVPWPVLEFPVL